MSTVIEPATQALRPVPVRPASRVDLIRAYVALTKPRIVELLLVTTVPAMILAGASSAGLIAAVLVGGALAAGAANALNCYLDRDIDEVMRRTARRPLPAHAVAPRNALIFGLALAAASTVLMAVFTNWLATALTVASIAYYDVVYTRWLKRTTPHNTFWGGICGAAPVLIGWAAVTGSLAAPAWVMFGVVFFWQMPHFYALALAYRDDYARAGIPMLPVVASARRVGLEAVGYAWLTVLTSIALWPLGMGWLYAGPAVAMGALFLVEAHGLYSRAVRQVTRADVRARDERGGGEAPQVTRADVRARDERGGGEAPPITRDEALRPMRLFHWSTTYLTVVFVAIAVDALVRH